MREKERKREREKGMMQYHAGSRSVATYVAGEGNDTDALSFNVPRAR